MNSKKLTDNETQRDASLVHPLHIVADPRDGVWNTRIDPQRPEEDPKVAQRRVVRSKQDSEAGDPDERRADIEDASFTGAVGGPANQHRHHTRRCVRRDRQKLGPCRRDTAESKNNGR